MLFLFLFTTLTVVSAQLDAFWEQRGYPSFIGPSSTVSNYGEGVVTQRLDNYHFLAKLKWNMRYLYNDQFFDGSGPMFILVGGEFNMYQAANYLSSGLMFDLAKKFKAYMFLPEHRFYGESVPDGDLRKKNLFFLGIKQAIGDLKNFIMTMKKNNPSLAGCQVVLFGSGYAGNLATWTKLDYPEVVDAVVASSAPLLSQVNFQAFFPGVQNGLANQSCSQSIQNSFKSLQSLLGTSDGRQKIQTDFSFCSTPTLTNSQEQIMFYKHLAAVISNKVKYGTTETIGYMCQLLCVPCEVDDYTRLVKYMNSTLTSCIPTYNDVVNDMKNTSLNPSKMARQWLYQQCTTLGWYETTDSSNQPFSNTIPISFYYKICKDVFNLLFPDMRVQMESNSVNYDYGGTNPSVTYTIFTQGTIDPWKSLGVTADLSNVAPAIVISGVSHAADFLPNSSNDPQSLTDARKQISNLLSSWLS